MNPSEEKAHWRLALRKALNETGRLSPLQVKNILAQYDKAVVQQHPSYAFVQLSEFYSDSDEEACKIFDEAKASVHGWLTKQLKTINETHRLTGKPKRRWNIDKLELETSPRDGAKTLEKVWSKKEQEKALNDKLQQSKANVQARAHCLDITVIL